MSDYDREDMNAGRAESISKESCVYSAVVGQGIRHAVRNEGTAPYLWTLPQTEGAEVEGMVPEVFRSLLDAKRIGKEMRLFTPFLEGLFTGTAADDLWKY